MAFPSTTCQTLSLNKILLHKNKIHEINNTQINLWRVVWRFIITSLESHCLVLCFSQLFSHRNLLFLQCLLFIRKHLLYVFLLFFHSCLQFTFNRCLINMSLKSQVGTSHKCMYVYMYVCMYVHYNKNDYNEYSRKFPLLAVTCTFLRWSAFLNSASHLRVTNIDRSRRHCNYFSLL